MEIPGTEFHEFLTLDWIIRSIRLTTVCHNLPVRQKATRVFTKTSHYRGHSAIVWHNTTLATLHSRVTVGCCSIDRVQVEILTFM